MNFNKILDDLIDLQTKYSRTKIATISIDRYDDFSQNKLGKGKANDLELSYFEDLPKRVSLRENVGDLPILATYLYPFLQNKKKINLGKTLIILAIHDIGETITGDVLSYNKKSHHEEKENAEAMNILHPDLLPNYIEGNELKSYDSKFAKSVDKLAPMLYSLSLPAEFMVRHYEVYGITLSDVINSKGKHFEWDKNLKKIFNTVIDRYTKRGIK